MRGFDFMAAKASSRQSVHDTLAVAAVYEDDNTVAPVPLTVRWHNKLSRAGALEGGFGVEVIEGIDRLVFNRPQLASKALELNSRGVVTITAPQWSARFSLEAREPDDGPVNEYWSVAHLGEDE